MSSRGQSAAAPLTAPLALFVGQGAAGGRRPEGEVAAIRGPDSARRVNWALETSAIGKHRSGERFAVGPGLAGRDPPLIPVRRSITLPPGRRS